MYGQPANLHVARFMGYRNVLELDATPGGGESIVVSNPDFKLAGTAKQQVTGKRAAVAIRPEEVIVGEGPGGANTIAGRIENVEYGGRDALLDIVTPSGAMLHARGPVSLRRGESVRVHVPADRVLVYPL